MIYKAIIDLLPVFDGTMDEMFGRVHKWAPRGTLAYSIDDALSLVKNAKNTSIIRSWHLNLAPSDDAAYLLGEANFHGLNVEFWNMPGYEPNVADVVNNLITKGSYPNRPLSAINHLAIHHTVGWDYSVSTYTNAYRISNYHVNSNGWPGIGYHFMIGPNGEILKTNLLTTRSNHVGTLNAPGDENSFSVGIVLGGDFRYNPPKPPQVAAASSLVSYLFGFLPSQLAVVPHKRSPGASTVCPGVAGLESWLREVANNVEWI